MLAVPPVIAAFERATGIVARDATRLVRGQAGARFRVRTDIGEFGLKVPLGGAAQVTRVRTYVERVRTAGVLVPEVIVTDVSNDLMPPFWVHAWIPGEDASRCASLIDAGEERRIASEVGRLLRMMHQLSAEVPLDRADELARLTLLLLDLQRLGEIRAPREILMRAEDWMNAARRRSAVLCHLDLSLENMLLGATDPEGRGRVWLLDLDEARYADPAEEFVRLEERLFAERPSMRASLLATYGAAPNDPYANHFYTLYHLARALRDARDGAQRDDALRPWMRARFLRLAEVRRSALGHWLTQLSDGSLGTAQWSPRW